MHGLINRSIQGFIHDTYGHSVWREIADQAGIGVSGFEALLNYAPSVTDTLLKAAEARLGSPRAMILEDVGTYLVSHPDLKAPRRLLRFGGEDFVEFLHSFDELPDRVRLAVPDLTFPKLELLDHSPRAYTLLVTSEHPGFGHAMMGVLRAMADDYGALVLLENRGRRHCVETISIDVIEARFAEGKAFALAECA